MMARQFERYSLSMQPSELVVQAGRLIFLAAILSCVVACTSALKSSSTPRGVIESPFENYKDHIRLHVHVGGHDYLAIYDSGAEVSLMSASLAKDLNIGVEAAEAGHGFGGDINSGRATNVKVEFGSGGYVFPNIAVVDFAQMLGPRSGVDFILGQTLLPDCVVEINPTNHVLRWIPRLGYKAAANATEVNIHFQNGSYTLPMNVDRVQGIAAIDVGAGTPIAVSAAFALKLGLNANDGASAQGHGVGGQYQSHLTSLPSITVAGVEMNDVPVEILTGELPDVYKRQVWK